MVGRHGGNTTFLVLRATRLLLDFNDGGMTVKRSRDPRNLNCPNDEHLLIFLLAIRCFVADLARRD
jgi:hypothetical protein